MTLIADLPAATSVSSTDLLLMQQQGITKTATVGLLNVFTGVQASNGAINLPSGSNTIFIEGDGGYIQTSASGGRLTIKSTFSTSVGYVTSIDVSGGVTGLSFSGGPITSAGTITLGGVLNLSAGGTGCSTQGSVAAALGFGTMATQNATAIAVSGGTLASVAISGGTYNAGTVTNVSVSGGRIVSANLAACSISGGTVQALSTPILLADGGVGASTAASARTILGLGTMATQNLTAIAVSGGTMASVAISGGTISGLSTPIALADGGVGASTASSARTILGLGTMATQNLTAIAVSGGTMASVAISGGTITGLTTPLPVGSGGTGLATVSAGQLFKGNGTGSMTVTGISVGSNNEIAGFKVQVAFTSGAYSTLAADTGRTLCFRSASSNEVTLTNDMVVGWCAEFIQVSSGAIHLSAATGATLKNRQGFTRTAGSAAAIRVVCVLNSNNSSAVYNMAGDATT